MPIVAGGLRPAKPDRRTLAEQKAEDQATRQSAEVAPAEYGGPKGLEPTRYGDWEKAGRCFDF